MGDLATSMRRNAYPPTASVPAPRSDTDDPRDRDLGFGRVVAQESRGRLLNRDGTFNVERHGLSFFASLSAYHWFVTMSWPRFVALVMGSLLLWNVLFAFAYVAFGSGGLVVSEGANMSNGYLVAFFFSVQTFATIGYGQIAPSGIGPNVVVVIESFTTILFLTLVTGIVFARFSRPTARVLFSDKAVIAPNGKHQAFMLRLVNARRSQLFEVNASVIVAQWTQVGERRVRRFAPLTLERPNVNFLPLAWTLVHNIEETSPLWGQSEAEMRASEPEFLVLLAGVDETWEQTVHARTSYASNDIEWGVRFADMFDRSRTDGLAIDVGKLSHLDG